MTTTLLALVLLCLMTGTAMAQQPKVTSLMSKDLPENPGREVLMITVEHAPSGSSPIHRHNAHAIVYVLRSEEHTSELQSRLHLVCRLLLEKKKKHAPSQTRTTLWTRH